MLNVECFPVVLRLNSALIAGKLPPVTHIAQARNVFDIELAALKAVRAQLDSSFDSAVETIITSLKQRGKTVVVGIGKSGNVGAKIAATLTSTGSTAVVLNSVDALHGDLGIVNDGDVILALSYSGESEELLNLLPALKRFLVKIISFTGNPKSSLALHSDLVLNVQDAGDAYDAAWTYNTDLFDEATAAAFARQYRGLVEQVLADPRRPLAAFSLADGEERRARLDGLAQRLRHAAPGSMLPAAIA